MKLHLYTASPHHLCNHLSSTSCQISRGIRFSKECEPYFELCMWGSRLCTPYENPPETPAPQHTPVHGKMSSMKLVPDAKKAGTTGLTRQTVVHSKLIIQFIISVNTLFKNNPEKRILWEKLNSPSSSQQLFALPSLALLLGNTVWSEGRSSSGTPPSQSAASVMLSSSTIWSLSSSSESEFVSTTVL